MLAASVISVGGTSMTLVAVPWYVLVTTGSPARAGLVGFFTIASEVVSGVLSGAVVDRIGLRVASIAADAGSAIATALVPLLALTVGLHYWELVVIVTARSLFDAPGNAARSALIVDAAGAAGIELSRANSRTQAATRFAGLLGAPLAGLLIALLGATNVLWLDAASYAVSALLFVALIPSALGRVSHLESAGYFRDLRAGFGAIASDPLIRTIVLAVLVTNFLESPMFTVITPVYSRNGHGGSAGLGLFFGALSLGGVLGALAFGRLASRLPRGAVYIGGFMGWGTVMAILAFVPGVVVPVLLFGVGGFCAGPLNVIIATSLQERIAPEMRARLFGTVRGSAYVAIPAGVLAGGVAVQAFGVGPVLIVIGSAYALTAASLFLNPDIRRM